jgi:hypothetical protein
MHEPIVPEPKPVFGPKVAQMQGAEKFATGAYYCM